MQAKTYEILIDIKNGLMSNQIIEVVTGDYGMNNFKFKLLKDKLVPYDLTNTVVRIMAITPSGSKQQQDCIVENQKGGTVDLTLKQSLFVERGEHIAELQIYDKDTQVLRLTTPRFSYFVRQSLQDDETIQASDEYSLLQQMIEDVGDINNNINTKVKEHNQDEESHPYLKSQINQIETDVKDLRITRGYANPNGLDILQVSSVNELIETGLYKVSSARTGDLPPIQGVYLIEVFKAGEGSVFHRATLLYTAGTIAGDTYERNFVLGVWIPWTKIVTTKQEQWIDAVLQNGWSAFYESYYTAQYYKDVFGIVHIRGSITGGTTADNTTLFTLPSGYRPQKVITATTLTSGSASDTSPLLIAINQIGEVKIIRKSGSRDIFLGEILFSVI